MSSSLDLLPADLAARSLSRNDIILPLDDAVRAAEHLAAAGHRLESWEGWVGFPDGMRTRSLEHSGSFVLPMDPARAAQSATEQMRAAQARWARRPEYERGTLWFHLGVARAS